MEAPVYAAACAFEQPPVEPFALGATTISLGELVEMPAAWDIVTRDAPDLKSVVASPQLKPHLFNLTVESFVVFGMVTSAQVEKIDAGLRALPRQAWSK